MHKIFSNLSQKIGLIILLLLVGISSLPAQTPTADEIENIARRRYPELFLPKDEYESSAEYQERLKEQAKLLRGEKNRLIYELESLKIEQDRMDKEKIALSREVVPIRIARIGMYNADTEAFVISVAFPGKKGIGYVYTKFGRVRKGFFESTLDRVLYSKPAFPSPKSKSTDIGKVNAREQYKIISQHGDFSKIESQSEKSISLTVGVPRSEAKAFKENYKLAKVEGIKQLKDDLSSYEYFNLRVTHPTTGSQYPIGVQKSRSENSELLTGFTNKKVIVPPTLEMRVAFIEPSGNGFLDAKEEGKIKVSVTNKGEGHAEGVRLQLAEKNKNHGIEFESSKFIGQIEPNKTKTATFRISSKQTVLRIMNEFTVSATEAYGFPPNPIVLMFETFPLIPPELALVDHGIVNAMGDNIIRHGVASTLQVRVHNRGQGEARNSRFYLQLPKGVYFSPESRQEYLFQTLQPNEYKDLTFSFLTAKTVESTIRMKVEYTEDNTKGVFPLTFEVETPMKTIQQLVVTGQELQNVLISDVATVSVDIEKNLPESRRKNKNDLAIVLGIERYKNVPGVTFAKRDAVWMKEYFETVFGIPSSRIYFKTDADVSLATFNVAFGGWLEKRLKKSSNVYIYYAGHGAPDLKENKAYLIPYDGDPNYASETGLPLEDIYAQLNELGAKSVTVFLDACFTGANRNNEMLLADARPVFMEVDKSNSRKVTVFSAAGSKEISSAWPEKKHGLFSYYLMKGCRGDADANSDRQITVEELSDYIQENVSEMAGMLDREQTPGLQSIDKNRVLIKY
jgi:hypothetical protein